VHDGSAPHGGPRPRPPQERIVHVMDCGKMVLVVMPTKLLPLGCLGLND